MKPIMWGVLEPESAIYEVFISMLGEDHEEGAKVMRRGCLNIGLICYV